MTDPHRLTAALAAADGIRTDGRVREVIGMIIKSQGPPARIGELCVIHPGGGLPPVRAEVVGFRKGDLLLMPIDNLVGLGPGMEVVATGHPLRVPVGDGLLGRILDGIGNPLDGRPLPAGLELRSTMALPPSPLSRQRISEPLGLGIRAIDGVLTVGRGQRLGIFSGSGVGKSTLMGMIARNTEAEVNVIGLVGERGREVKDFLEKDLGPEGLQRSVLVVATSDQPALIRLRAAFVAVTIAEYFRDRGRDVMLMMDSITRFCRAHREVGTAIGEPVSTRGFPASTWDLLAKMMERPGRAARGTITAFFTILVEGDDMNEPVADNARGILDGHLVLSRELASRNHYPAIDVLESISRLMVDIVPEAHLAAARKLQRTLSVYRQAEDLINIGAYQAGSNPEIDYALKKVKEINAFLQQRIDEAVAPAETVRQLQALMAD